MITNITAIRPNGTLQHMVVVLRCGPELSPVEMATGWLFANFPDFTLYEVTVRYRAS